MISPPCHTRYRRLIRRCLLGGGLVLLAVLWTVSNPAYGRTLSTYFDDQLPGLKKRTYQRIRTLTATANQAKNEYQSVQAELDDLQSKTNKIKKNRLTRGLRSRTIKKNEALINTLTAKSDGDRKEYYTLSRKLKRSKNFYAAIKAEIKKRQNQKKYTLTKNVSLYDAEELIEAQKAYQQMVNQYHSQYQYYKDQLANRSNPTDAQSIEIKKRVDRLRSQTSSTELTLNTIDAELDGRLSDHSGESQILADREAAKRQNEAYFAKKNRQRQKKMEGERLLKDSALLRMIDDEDPKLTALEEAQKKERPKQLLIGAILIGFVLLVLKKVLS